jgi:DNA-binding transcriptional LysR family regulator
MTMSGLRNVDVRQLTTLVAVAEEGSFGRAAGALGFSQAAVSQQVAALEKAVGMKLFDRPGGPRAAVLTPAGRLLLEHAHAVVARLDQAGRQLADLAAGLGGRLDVGTFQSASVALLPAVIAQLRREAPEVDIVLHETDVNDDLLRRLAVRRPRRRFRARSPRRPPGRRHPSVRRPVRGGHPCRRLHPKPSTGRTGAMPLAGLDGFPVIGQNADDSCQVLIDDGLKARGCDAALRVPQQRQRSDPGDGDRPHGRRGHALARGRPRRPDRAHPCVRPPLEPREICVAVRSDRTHAPAALRLVELAREHTPDVGAVRMTVH